MLVLPAVLIEVAVVLLPSLLAARTSLAHTSLAQNYTGWTFSSYDSFFGSVNTRSALIGSIEISLMATGFGIIVSYPIAIFLHGARTAVRRVLVVVLVLPLLISVTVRSYSLVVIFSPGGLVNSIPLLEHTHLLHTKLGVALGLLYTLVPFMVLPLLASLANIQPALLSAAQSLGAGSVRITKDVLIPLTAPAAIAGATLIFSLSMTSFVIPVLLGGVGNLTVMALVSQEVLAVFNWPAGFAMAMVLVIVAGVIVGAGRYFLRRANNASST
jgi:putative spermidine/putrescine transport system permease protein